MHDRAQSHAETFILAFAILECLLARHTNLPLSTGLSPGTLMSKCFFVSVLIKLDSKRC